jgi:hypothetical protein
MRPRRAGIVARAATSGALANPIHDLKEREAARRSAQPRMTRSGPSASSKEQDKNKVKRGFRVGGKGCGDASHASILRGRRKGGGTSG